MSDPDSAPWDLDDLDEAILDLDRERLAPLLAERHPHLALVPDLDCVDYRHLARLCCMPNANVVVASGPYETPEGEYPLPVMVFAVDERGDLEGQPATEPFALDGSSLGSLRGAIWRPWPSALEGHLREILEREWKRYYRAGRESASQGKPVSRDAISLDADIARHLRAAARGLRQRGDEELGRSLESAADQLAEKPRLGRPPGKPKRFEIFLGQLLRIITYRGGRLTYSRGGGGSLIALLDQLRPLLPPRFIPEWKQPPSSIERMKARAAAKSLGRTTNERHSLIFLGVGGEGPGDLAELLEPAPASDRSRR